MRSPTQNKKQPPEAAANLDQLRQQVKHAEDHGNFNTCHHTLLLQLESVPGLITGKKETRTEQDEVNDGKQNA